EPRRTAGQPPGQPSARQCRAVAREIQEPGARRAARRRSGPDRILSPVRRPPRQDEGEELETAEAEGGDDERRDRGDRGERFNRNDRDRGRDREPRGRDRDQRPYRDERSADQSDEDDEAARQVNGADDDSLPLDVLPPAIGADGPTTMAIDEDEQPAPKPRRRTRAARPADGDDEVSPAA